MPPQDTNWHKSGLTDSVVKANRIEGVQAVGRRAEHSGPFAAWRTPRNRCFDSRALECHHGNRAFDFAADDHGVSICDIVVSAHEPERSTLFAGAGHPGTA
jgi:hypothetical protein